MKKNYKLFWYQEGFVNTYTQNIIWYNTNYVRKNNVFSYVSVQENTLILFVTLIYLCTDLYFLCEYFFYLSAINFTPITRVLVIET